jgi:hypothetical protein
MIERDYLMRMVQQLAAVMTRIFNLKKQEKYDEARETIREAYGELFGLNRALLETLSAESLAQLVGDYDKSKAIARLFQEEASLDEFQKNERRARERYRRALELYLETTAARAHQDPEILEAIHSLVDKIGRADLSERYSEMLRKLRR